MTEAEGRRTWSPTQLVESASRDFLAGVGNSQLGCTKIRDSREILEIPKDSMRGEIGRFWPGRTRVYEDSGELPTPAFWHPNAKFIVAILLPTAELNFFENNRSARDNTEKTKPSYIIYNLLGSA